MGKQLLSGIFLTLTLSTCVFGVFGGGSGTAGIPYLISTPEHLQYLSDNYSAYRYSHFKMVQDIDLLNAPFAPILSFGGVFDGNGYTIYHYELDNACASNIGFFCEVTAGGIVKNLMLVNARLQCLSSRDSDHLGLLVGYLSQNARITNCHLIGGYAEIVNSDTAYYPSGGGIAGYIQGSVENCSVRSTTVIGSYAGGIAGHSSGTIQNCTAYDINVNGSWAGGGICGMNMGTITQCAAQGTIYGYWYSGGLIGMSYGYSNFYPVVQECYASCTVTSYDNSGGLLGSSSDRTLVINCYSMGTADSTSHTGGLVSCMATWYGGANPQIEKCYSITKVLGPNIGGLVNHVHTNTNPYIVSDSFWDINITGVPYSARGEGKTTAQMQTQGTFTGWDFNTVWYMRRYPALRWEINPLQAQIDAAQNGDIIVVPPGVYMGPLYFKGKNITLTSTDPTNPEIVASTVLKGRGTCTVVTFNGTENETCVLSGFTITNGYTTIRGAGVDGGDCHAMIRHCIFQNNTANGCAGGGIWGIHGLIENCIVKNNSAKYGGGIAKCNATLRNCLIIQNRADMWGSGLNNCDGSILNCTIAPDVSPHPPASLISYCDGQFTNCIFAGSDTLFEICTAQKAYCCWPGAEGTGNIDTDPLFIDPANGDYHLLPDSPCIDAGDPTSDYSYEPWPNGTRTNVGAYGNTSEAARSKDGLIPLGFEIINKTPTGGTTFEYELAVIVYNSNPYDMTGVQMPLKNWDSAVLSVSDNFAEIDSLQAGEIKTSQDTFTLTLDRSLLVPTGRLTWELTYYVPAYEIQVQQSTVSIASTAIDSKAGDITGEGEVNFTDFAVLASQWDKSPQIPSADIAPPLDGHVGMEDLLYLAQNWLQ